MLSYDDPRLTLPDAGEGQRLQVNAGVAAMRKQPTPDATQVSQVLHGETVILHHEEGEFGLVQCEHDRYVGWVLMEALSAPALRPSQRVITGRLHTYAEPKVCLNQMFVLGSGALPAVDPGDRESLQMCYLWLTPGAGYQPAEPASWLDRDQYGSS